MLTHTSEAAVAIRILGHEVCNVRLFKSIAHTDIGITKWSNFASASHYYLRLYLFSNALPSASGFQIRKVWFIAAAVSNSSSNINEHAVLGFEPMTYRPIPRSRLTR